MELHEPPWTSMSLHGVPDNVGGPQYAPYILVIFYHSHRYSQGEINDTYYENI